MPELPEEPRDQVPVPATPTWKDRLPGLLKKAGALGLGGVAVTVLVAWLVVRQVDAQLTAASQETARLHRQVGMADQGMKEVNLRVERAKEVMQRLEKLDAQELKLVLELVERPAFKDVLKAGELAKSIEAISQKTDAHAREVVVLADRAKQLEGGQKVVAKQVADIYGLAAWSSGDEYRSEPNLFRNLIASVWTRGQLQEQRQSGSPTATWFDLHRERDSWKDHIHSQTVKQHVEESTDEWKLAQSNKLASKAYERLKRSSAEMDEYRKAGRERQKSVDEYHRLLSEAETK